MKCRELVSVAELTTSERTAFVNALLALKSAPSRIALAATAVTNGGGTPNRYDDYVWMHSTVGSGAHFGPAFGPWHREFLRQLEFDLRQVSGNPDIVIPYWDWTTGRAAGDPNWPFTDDLLGPLGDATGIVQTGPFSNPATWRMNIRRRVATDGVNDTNLRLRRRPAVTPAGFNLPNAANARAGAAHVLPYDALPYNEATLLEALFQALPGETEAQTEARIIAQITAWTSASFRKFLEWVLHNGVHTWVGGDDDLVADGFIGGPMAFPPVAVNDPTFWLHHCNIDRLWSAWQQRNPPGGGALVAAYAPTTGAGAGHNLNNEMTHFQAANAGNFNTSLRSTPAAVVDSRGALDIWYKSDLPLITLVTPSVDFGDVPANLTTDWPVKFDVRTCRRVKFRIGAVGGANFSIPSGQGDVNAEHNDVNDPVRSNVFLEFHALGAANVVQPGTATINAFIDDTEGYFTGAVGAEYQVGTWPVGLSARPVPAPRAAVTFVLDRSGSMADSAGPAGTKYDLLRSSLRVVAALMRNDDAIGLVTFDSTLMGTPATATLTPTMPQMGTVSPPGAGRQAVETAITSGELEPRNGTAIGQGMIAGATVLQTVQADTNYPNKAMVVMTDGNENVDPLVTDSTVTSAIAWFNNSVYAIGLGDETNVSAATLGAVARYQLITGNITTSAQQFLLTKYFLQILAQISDSAIVVDPQGELRPGDVHRIPFDLGECDVSVDVVAICPVAPLLDLTLEAPDGTVIDVTSGPNVTLQIDAGDEFYRVQLPAIPGNAAGTHAGRWTAVLRIRDLRKDAAAVMLRRSEAGSQVLAGIDKQALASVAKRGALPYQLFVQSYSNLTMAVEVRQDSFLPGTELTLLANLQEYRLPVAGRARVVVEVSEPDGREVHVQLDEVAPGRFKGKHATADKGIYRCRFRAAGTTRAGQPFQREDTRTAAINARLAPGGDLSPTAPGGGKDDHDRQRWCELVSCLLHEPSIVRFLEKHEVNPREVAACLKRYCASARASKTVTHVPAGRLAAQEVAMSEETDRLRGELAALRAQLKKEAAFAFDSIRWDDLLAAAPAPKPVPAPPEPVGPAAEDQRMEAHHNRALPALVMDDDGTTRLFLPAGHRPGDEHHGHRPKKK
jgi:hypothetical protein